MQVERKIDSVTRVVIFEVIGELADPDLLSLAELLERDAEVSPDFSLLMDLRQAHGQNVTSAGVRALAARPLVLSLASRRAVVVPSDLGYGMARMYEILGDKRGGATRVFRDYGDARRWVETGAE